MNPFALSGLLILISSLFFGFFVFIKGIRHRVNQLWGIFSIAVALWGLAALRVGLIPEEGRELAVIWWRLTYLGIIFIPVLFYHFVHVWLGLKRKIFLYLFYLWGLFFFILEWTTWADLFFGLDTITYVFSTAYIVRPATPLYTFFVLCWFSIAFYSHYELYKAFKKSVGLKRSQIKYFFLATAIGFSGGGATFLIPFGVNLYPFLNFTVPLYPAIMAYAILKHHLLNIKVIATELLAFVMVAFSFTQIFFLGTTSEIIVKIIFFIGVLVIGILLVRSVIKVEALNETKSEFLSIASHQLRTPLSFIKGNVSMTLEGIWGNLTQDQKKELEKVYISNERLIKLVDDLLDISRIESGRMEYSFESVSLEEMVENMVKDFLPTARIKKLDLKYEKPKKPLSKVKADPLKIRQVVMNLIDNAIKYTEEGGGVTVGLKEENNKVIFWVKDTGIGIAPKQQKLLFQKFSRAKGVTKVHTEGMGLGLYLGAELIKAHKGKIWVESEGEGKGSTFYFELPVEK